MTKISKKCEELLPKVNNSFSHFTNHDIRHSYRVANFMYELLPCSEENYCNSELVIMLYAAMMHDLGMVDTSFDPKSSEDLEELRKNHHKKSAEMIMNKDMFEDDLFLIDGISVRREVADAAKSHNESVKWIIENIREHKGVGNDSVNLRFICYLLRIADLIDFDNQRTPLIVYSFFEKEFKKDEWKISDDEWKKQLSVTNFNHVIIDREKRICRISFEAEVESSSVCRNLFRYFKYIEKEITEIERFKSADDRYTLYIDPKVEQRVEQDRFDVKPLIQYVDYLSVANILIGENIYDKKEYALREIVQNAMDAVLLMKEIKNNSDYAPQIKIRMNDNTLFIEDNGIGMTREVIENYFLCIGKSFYRSKDYTYAYKPISHYGVGFLSSYLLSKKVVVRTSSYKDSNKQIELELNKDDEYVVFSESRQEVSRHGTIVEMSLGDVLAVFGEKEKIKWYLENTFVNPKISVIFNDGEHGDEVVQSIEFDEDYGEYLNGILLKCDVKAAYGLVYSCDDFLCDENYALVKNDFIECAIVKDFLLEKSAKNHCK